ncbi:MAG: hypothetical protein KA165_15630 [Saprospiraceae bacterium]|nr:hypothetical protein [Saprospiraceae bacterium]
MDYYTTLRTYILLLATLILSTASVQAQWQFLGGPETGNALYYAEDGGRVYVCTPSGLLFSDNGALSWTPMHTPTEAVRPVEVHADQNNVYLISNDDISGLGNLSVWRTDDGGSNWKDVSPKTAPYTDYKNIALKGDTLVLFYGFETYISKDRGDTYLQIQTLNGPSAKFFFKEDSLIWIDFKTIYSSPDLGITWQPVYSTALSITDVILIDSTMLKCEMEFGTFVLNISKSEDGGYTWSDLLAPGNFFNSAKLLGDGDNLFLWDGNGGNILYSSADGGYSWTSVGNYTVNGQIYFFNDVLFFARGGDVLISSDEGATQDTATTGFQAASVTGVFPGGNDIWASVNANISWPGFQKSVHKRDAGTGQWLHAPFEQIAATDDGHLFALSNDTLMRSDDGGANWYVLPPPFFWGGTYYSFMDLSAAGNIVYLTRANIYVYSKDYGENWLEMPPLFGDAFGFVSYDNGKYTAATSNSVVLQSTDGINWQSINYNLVPPGNWGIDMLHSGNGYVFVYAAGKLWRLAPLGSVWEVMPNPVQGMPPGSDTPLVMAMASAGNLLAAGIYGHGIYISTDNGSSWKPANFNLGDYQVRSLKVVGQDLLAGVDGGVWKRPLSDFGLNQFSGVVYNDLNANGIKDQNESGIHNVLLRLKNQQIYSSSGKNGEFILFSTGSGNDTLEAIAPAKYSIVTTAPVPVSGSASKLDFGINYLTGIQDAAVNAALLFPIRPGFETDCIITVKNAGTDTTDVTAKLILDQQVEFISASVDSFSIDGDTLTWLLAGVVAGESRNIGVRIKAPANAAIGTDIQMIAWVAPQSADASPDDNLDTLTEVVVGSFDPNDKSVFPAGVFTPQMIADTQRLVYTIRFQNTGNFPASFVRIQDTLSPFLDISSLQIRAASHPFTWQMMPGNVLEFYFPDIKLPGSNMNETDSHGFVEFSIDAKTGLQISDRIENSAAIYFDFNTPVITNTVTNIVSTGSGVSDIHTELQLETAPLPAHDYLYLTIRSANLSTSCRVWLSDIQGNLILEQETSFSDSMRLDVRDLPPGNYVISAQSGSKRGVVMIMKI